MNERIQLNYDPPQGKPPSINKVVDFLKTNEFDPEQHFYEFEISGEIEPSSIRTLLQLPYEITLTEYNGKLFLTTGLTNRIGEEPQLRKRMHHSKLAFHTHPVRGNERSINTPSFTDVYISVFADPSTPLSIAYREGIMVYRKPFIDPDTGNQTKEDPRELVFEYAHRRGIDIFGFLKLDKNL